MTRFFFDIFSNLHRGFEFIGNTDGEEMLEKYPMMITIDKIWLIISEIGTFRT